MKENITKLKISLLIFTVIGFGSGCNSTQNQLVEDNDHLSISQVHTKKPINQSVANHTKEVIVMKEGISDVKAVNTDKDLLVGIKVDNFDRFQLKKIKKDVQSDIDKMYPNHQVTVSTDQKMYWELDKLEQRLKKDNTTMKNLKKDINKIKSLMKEQT